MTTDAPATFAGFPREGLDFLDGLARENTREWFDAHRSVYQSALLEPAKAFVVALGAELRERVSPGIRAEPRVNGSILRINRDTRFGADKKPYKDHLDLWFWEGDGPSREHPGYFVRLRPTRIVVGAGMHRFPYWARECYRDAVGIEPTGRALEEALERATELAGVTVGGGDAYKRVPQGYLPDHPRADLLRHGALYVALETKVPREFSKPGFVPWVAERMERMAPVERWLTTVFDDPV